MHSRQWKRREFITLVGGTAAAWPLAARAQQPAMPVVGYLNLAGSPESDTSRLTGLRRGLNQTGYVEGRNFLIEYRWAGNQADRLPALAADLVQLQVAAIVAVGPPPALAAKAATTSIPIVFGVGADPVQFGLVGSLNRPGGNLTGANWLVGEFGAKGLSLLHELVPSAATIGFLENPKNPTSELTMRDVLAAAPVVGVKVQILKASTDREIDAAFASLVQAGIGALLVGSDFLFNSRMEQLIALAARYAIPTMYDVAYRHRLVEADPLFPAPDQICQRCSFRPAIACVLRSPSVTTDNDASMVLRPRSRAPTTCGMRRFARQNL
jgi:putative tryptophan/tyrosine transport system substrate-binding protein